VDQALFLPNGGAALRDLVVWVPKLGAAERHVSDATEVVKDRRATHYWDEGGKLMAAFTSVLELPEDAWDIYMIYRPGVRWDGRAPPKPDYWMHQLGSASRPRVKGPFLDPKEFAANALRILRSSSPTSTAAKPVDQESTR
jgi:hypothetical protein